MSFTSFAIFGPIKEAVSVSEYTDRTLCHLIKKLCRKLKFQRFPS